MNHHHASQLTVQLLTWNGAKYIPYLFSSLRKQSFRDWELVIFDNASQDSTFELMKHELKEFPVSWKLHTSSENFGFAGGHNHLFHASDSQYLLLLNQDMYLDASVFERLIAFMETHPETASVSPRLMRWNFSLLFTFMLQGSAELVGLGRQTYELMDLETGQRASIPEQIKPILIPIKVDESNLVYKY